MPASNRVANPFALMLDPQGVLASVAHSERLSRLHSRVCRPLDKPLLSGAADGADGEADGERTPDEPASGDAQP